MAQINVVAVRCSLLGVVWANPRRSVKCEPSFNRGVPIEVRSKLVPAFPARRDGQGEIGIYLQI